MAKEKQTTERLVVRGNPVVALPDGNRLQLSGDLTDEQREQLGEGKINSLRRAGHLRTEEEIQAEEDRRAALSTGAANVPDAINPNFGTPSMTPEALQAAGAAEDSPAVQAVKASQPSGEQSGEGGGDQSKGEEPLTRDTPVRELGLAGGTVEALEKAGLNTVGELTDFGAAHNGLAGHVEGIGDGREREIRTAIERREKKR